MRFNSSPKYLHPERFSRRNCLHYGWLRKSRITTPIFCIYRSFFRRISKVGSVPIGVYNNQAKPLVAPRDQKGSKSNVCHPPRVWLLRNDLLLNLRRSGVDCVYRFLFIPSPPTWRCLVAIKNVMLADLSAGNWNVLGNHLSL